VFTVLQAGSNFLPSAHQNTRQAAGAKRLKLKSVALFGPAAIASAFGHCQLIYEAQAQVGGSPPPSTRSSRRSGLSLHRVHIPLARLPIVKCGGADVASSA
jgi:hypothetical protein